VRNLCNQVEAMVVVGGRASANTMRLGEIAASMGRPVFVVETEEELDVTALRKFDCIGVTAGASTPTWMINRVVRTLESVPGCGQGVILPMLARFFWIMLATNLYVSLGGGLLTLVACTLQNIQPHPEFFIIGFGYLFAMHNLNRFTDRKSDKFSDPLQTIFYRRYRWPLFLISSLALTGAITITAGLGQRPLLLLITMSILGILYAAPIIPKPLAQLLKIRGLKEIPGSKTIFVSLAWAFVSVLIPVLSLGNSNITSSIGTFAFIFLLVFMRSALLDIFEVLGDKIVGKETLPVNIGEKKTMILLYGMMMLQAAILLLFPLYGWINSTAYQLLPTIIYLFVIGKLYANGKVRQGAKLEFALESVFILAAALTLPGMDLL